MIARIVFVALAVSLLAARIVAAEEAAPPRAALEEIVVTAQRREERLQDTPVSVVALSGDDMRYRGIASVKDLREGQIPSVRVIPFFGRASAMSVSMRGVPSGEVTQLSQDPPIGIYLDGVYLGRVQGLGTELIDVERMEVLRGPQGTLFGRNAVGGAISFVSRRPSGEPELRLRAGAGNLSSRNVRGSLDLPKFGDLSVKIDGLISRRDGWVSNSFDAHYAYDRSRDESTSGYMHITAFLDDRPQSPLVTIDDGRASQARFGAPLEPSVGKAEGHLLNMSYALTDQITLRSISAYRKLEQSQRDQWTGSFFGLEFAGIGLTGRYSLAEVDQDQFSQELQLLGNTDRLNYIVGLFYFEEEGEDSAGTVIPLRFADGGVVTLDPFIAGSRRESEVESRSRAIYGQATWTPPVLDDRLDVTFGLRYTDDKRQGILTSANPLLGFRHTEDRWDPAFILAYRWTEEINSYMRWSRAYRAGGANNRSSTYRPFDAEEVTSWELGLKTEFWERRARVNLAVYYAEWDDRTVAFGNPLDPSITEILNTPETVKLRGLELDTEIVPLEGARFTFSYAYVDPTEPELTNPFPPNPTLSLPPSLSPKHAFSGSAEYVFAPFRNGRVRLHVNTSYASGHFITFPRKTDSHTLVNGRITLEEVRLWGNSELEIALWGRNLFDKEYTYANFEFSGAGLSGAQVDWFGPPRTYGLELTVRM